MGKVPEKVVVRSECDLYDLYFDHAAEHRRKGQLSEASEGLGESNANKEAVEQKEKEEGKEIDEEITVTEDSDEGEDNDS